MFYHLKKMYIFQWNGTIKGFLVCFYLVNY